MKVALACSVLLGVPSLPAMAQSVPGTEPCSRSCLTGFVDRYMDAMLAHKVSDALFAHDTKFTENGVQLPLGTEGLWFRMSAQGTYKFYVPDVETQQIAFFGFRIVRLRQDF